LSFSGYKKTLFIYGPKGTKDFVKQMLNAFAFQKNFEIKVEEVNGKFIDTKDFYIESEKMKHGIPCNAYSFVKKGKLRINKEKLKKTKLSGPILKKLKEGKDIVYEGKKYLAKNMTYGEAEKKISFVFDTSFNEKIIPFVKNSDLLICESTFGEELEERADKYKHLTVKQTAEIAKKSKSKKLVLTHISQRYSKNPKKILNTAKKIFKNTALAEDFDKIKL
jgi:ribonuclease Z